MQRSHKALPRVKKAKFQCIICPAEFSCRYSLSRHWKSKHPEHCTDHIQTQEAKKALAHCLEDDCQLAFRSRHELRKHLVQQHGLRQDEIHKEFSTEEEFYGWKNKIENCTNSNYIRACGGRAKKDGTRLVYFDCNRSGKPDESFIPDEKRRKKETCKIGTLCPAQLAVQVEWGKVSVRWYPTHYGHSISLEHIRIPKLEMKAIKERILAGEEFDRILYDAQQSEDRMEVPDEVIQLLELEEGQNPVSQPRLSLLSRGQLQSMRRHLQTSEGQSNTNPATADFDMEEQELPPYIPREARAISVDFEVEESSHSSLKKARSSPAEPNLVDIELVMRRQPFFRLLEEAHRAVEKLDFTVDTSNALSSLSATVQKLKDLADPDRKNRPPAPNPLVWKQNSLPVEIYIGSPEQEEEDVEQHNLYQNDMGPQEVEQSNFCPCDAQSNSPQYRVPEEKEVIVVEEEISFPIKHCPLPRLLDTKAILEPLGIDTREEVILVSDFLADEHTYAAHAPIKLDDLTQEELNLLKVLVDPDFLRVFLKQLRKGALSPLKEASLTKNKLYLNDLSWPILVLGVYPRRILSSLFTPEAFTKVVAALDAAREQWKCADCNYVREERMIMCDECRLWFHFSCQDLEKAPPTVFQCRDCYLKPWNDHEHN